jgi:uncharacterized protein (TIRG00374 family)
MKIPITLLKLLVTLSILLFLLSKLDLNKIFELINKVEIIFLLFSLLLLLVQVVLSSFRWHLLLTRINVSIDFLSTMKLLWIGLFFNQTLPTGIGGDVVRAYLLKKKGIGKTDAISGVIWDRVTGMIGLIILIFFGSLFTMQLDNSIFIELGLASSFLLLFIIFSALYIGRIPIFNKSSLVQNNKKYIEHGRALCLSKGSFIKIIGLSIVIQFFSVLSVLFIGLSMGLSISVIGMLVIVPLSILTMALPISFAGWGVREGVMVAGLSSLGVGSEVSFSISIVYGFGLLLVSLLGGVLWFLGDRSV